MRKREVHTVWITLLKRSRRAHSVHDTGPAESVTGWSDRRSSYVRGQASNVQVLTISTAVIHATSVGSQGDQVVSQQMMYT